MKLVVVSANPLFAEVLHAAMEGHDNFEISLATPGEFTQVLENVEPAVIIVDESLGQAEYEPVLAATRERTSSHVILLNPKDNSVCVLDSRRTIIQDIDDLYQAIARQKYDTCAGASGLGDANARVEASTSPTKEVEHQQN